MRPRPHHRCVQRNAHASSACAGERALPALRAPTTPTSADHAQTSGREAFAPRGSDASLATTPVAAVSLLAMVMWAGCAGCGVPFEFTQEGSVVLPVWAQGDCAWGGTLPVDGQPDAVGQLVRWTQERDGDRCAVEAEWMGPLVDMESTRQAVDAQLDEAGLDPRSVGLVITAITPTLQLVPASAAGFGTSELSDGVILEYAGELSVSGSAPVLSFAFRAPGDPLRPALDIDTPPGLLEQVNAAWEARAPLAGAAAGRVVLGLDVLQATGGVPAVELRLGVTVAGEVFAARD